MKPKKHISNNPAALIKSLWPFIAAAVMFLLVRVAVNNPALVERYYSDGFYPFYAAAASSFSGFFPFSLWDLFWGLAILALVAGIIFVIVGRLRLRWFLLRTAQTLAILYSLFYLSWGFNYFRPELIERSGLTVIQADEELFRTTLDTIIARANRYYVSINVDDYKDIDVEIEKSYEANASNIDVGYPNGSRTPKKMIVSGLIAKLGISGYFGPFFNEVNINAKTLPMDYPFLLAHEKAHQFGIASEADANFAAFAVCIASGCDKLRYSGYLTLMMYFLGDAHQLPDYKDYVAKIEERILADIRFSQRYYKGLRDEKMEKAHGVVYDVYLKQNNVERGIKDYNQVVKLAISLLNSDSMQLKR